MRVTRILFLSFFLSCFNEVCIAVSEYDDISSTEELIQLITERPALIRLTQDSDYLDGVLNYSDPDNISSFLKSYSSGMEIEEYFIRESIWKTIVKNWPAAARRTIVEIIDVGDESAIDITISLAKTADFDVVEYGSDYRESVRFKEYENLIDVDNINNILPLIGYFFQSSPEGAINIFDEIIREDLGFEESEKIFEGIGLHSELLNQYRGLPQYHEFLDELESFFSELIIYDKWYFDAYMAAHLEKARLRNVSDNLNMHLLKKENSIANWLREEKTVSNLVGRQDVFIPIQRPKVFGEPIIAGDNSAELRNASASGSANVVDADEGDFNYMTLFFFVVLFVVVVFFIKYFYWK